MRWLRRTLIGVVVLLALFYGLGGWHFSNVLDERALDGADLRADYPPPFDLRVAAIGDGSVALEPLPGEEAPPELTRPGTWTLVWDGGWGTITDVSEGEGSAATHTFELGAGQPPPVGDSVRIDPRLYDDDAGVDDRQPAVAYDGPLGSMPAREWWNPNQDRRTWVIVVHGNSMNWRDGLHSVPTYRDEGFPVLVMSYRNDDNDMGPVPRDPSGKLRYGLTEWEDLEAAVQYALDNGATDVVLDGYSMGGGVIMAFLQRSELADDVTAVVMDAPMLDFGTTVDDNASRETLPVVGLPLPSSLTAVAKQIAAWRFGVDWKALDYLDTDPGVPTLIFHGTEDLTVPIGTSVDFARRYADVTLERCPDAGHIQCWNIDPGRYEAALRGFLQEEVGSQEARVDS